MPLDDFTSKTESPTPRKILKARERGMVPRSAELASAASFLAGLVLLTSFGDGWIASFGDFMGRALRRAARPEEVMMPAALLQDAALRGAEVFLPIAIVMASVAGLVALVQGGAVFSFHPIAQSAARLNVFNGLKQILSFHKFTTAGWAGVRLLVAAVLGVAVAWPWIRDRLDTPARSAADLITFGGDLFGGTLLRLAAILAALALADTLLTRWQHLRALRMTKEEVRDERRETEGDPMVRSRQRSRRLELARRRMMAEVPKADVVVTNPTQVAVALRYDALKMAAPKVVAKGRGPIAEKIREIARRHRVPIVEDPPLARSLLRMVPLGASIPPQLYRAVAELLAWVYRLRRSRRKEG